MTPEIPVSYVLYGLTLLAGLIGIIYHNLAKSIEGLSTKHNTFSVFINQEFKEIRREMKVLEQNTPDKETCILCSKIAEEKFTNIHGRVDELKLMNRENHLALVASLKELHSTVNTISACVVKLSSQHEE